MGRWILAAAAAWLAVITAAHADTPIRFDSCAELRAHIDAMQPNQQALIAPNTFVCKEPPNPSADGLRIDFGGSRIKVADQALRPGIVIGDLETPPKRRHKDITVLNLEIDGNGPNQAFECWGGPCNASNPHPLRQERSNGISVNGCDHCTVINVKVTDARSGGMVVVSSDHLMVDGFEAKKSCFDGLAGYETHNSVFRNVLVHDNDYAGFSFDDDFSDNRFEDFRAQGNHDQGMFIRDASGNRFVRGLFEHNAKNGVYFDQDNQHVPTTCATDTSLSNVTVRGNGQYGAWLQFACRGNQFLDSTIEGNRTGCFGGAAAALIGSTKTICIAAPNASAQAAAQGVRPHCR
jgi:hypothetical protein